MAVVQGSEVVFGDHNHWTVAEVRVA